MSRALKDLYPCRGVATLPCEDRVKVRSRRDIDHARCERCSELRRHMYVANSLAERAHRLFDEHNEGSEFVIELCANISKAVTAMCKAAEHSLFVASLMPDEKARTEWCKAAVRRMKWAAGISFQLREMLSESASHSVRAKKRGLIVLDGGLTDG